VSFKDRSLDKIPELYAKWHQRRFLLTRSQSRHVGKTDEGNLKLVLNVASSKDTMFLLNSLRERGHCGELDVDGRIILRWIFRKWEGVVGTEWSGLRIRTGGVHL
jgi:hypothetical protein